MRRVPDISLSLFFLVSLVAACAQPASPPAKPAAATTGAKTAESKPAESKPAAAKTTDKAAEAKPAIKIGYLTPLTGVFAATGQDMKDGFALFIEENGGLLGGRKVELLVEDDEAKPDAGLTKAKKLVERDRVNMLAGIIHSGVAYGVAEYVKEQKTILFINNAGADDLTQRQFNPYLFRDSFSNSQTVHPQGEWAYKKGFRKAALVSSDYAAGWEYSGGFARTFTEAGGQIVQELYTPLGAPDPSPFITAIKPEVDVVYAFQTGADALRFVPRFEEYGVKKRAALLGPPGITDDTVLPQQGDSALGVFPMGGYSTELDLPANKAFLAAFNKRYNRMPTYYSEVGYSGAKMLGKALDAIGGNVEDKQALVAALEKVEIPDSPRGPIKFDKYHNVVMNVYAMEVKKVGGKLVNTVIETYKDVTQFWKWTPEEFMRMPSYVDLKGKWVK